MKKTQCFIWFPLFFLFEKEKERQVAGNWVPDQKEKEKRKKEKAFGFVFYLKEKKEKKGKLFCFYFFYLKEKRKRKKAPHMNGGTSLELEKTSLLTGTL